MGLDLKMGKSTLSLLISLSALCMSCSKNSEEKEQTTPVSSVSLNLSNAEMVIGGTIQLVATISPADATEENVVWKSSNKAVASVSQSGLVTAISIGSSTITASVAGKKANCSITVKKEVDYVDLGLSVKWATKNMGAQTASDVGDYYAWGEIETRSSYDISNYKWYRDDDYTPFTKYNYKWNDYYKDGEADNIMRLELDDDVAHVKLGDLWRMPTYEEIQELVSTISDSKYKWEWKTGNGQYGWHIVYLNNGNSIFLPASGYKHGLSISQEGTDGYYWSSSLYDRSAGPYGRYGAFYAKTLHIDSEHIEGGYKARELGLAIRPVFGAIEVSSIDLNEPDLVLFEGETETLVATVLPDDATDRIITWSTSDASIATVKNGKVTALKVGQVTITAKAGDKTSTCTVTITHFPDGEYTDLGLSVKWGNQNIGAEKISDYGEYYAWGEIDTKSDYSWSTYKWCNGSYESLTKYNTYSEYGVVDNKTKLDLSDDVAHMKLGGNWRMPTSSEIKELITTKNSSNYKWKWTSINGHNGYVIIYQGNYNSIFLPASGYWANTSLYNDKSSGYYWSSSCGNYGSAYYISFTSEYARYTSEVVFREDGYSVRPVYVENLVIDVESIELNKTELNLMEGESETLVATVKPDNATDKTVTWTSSDQSIATVENGKVTALKNGDATITAKAGNQTATCKIDVSSNGEYADLGLSVKWATKNLGAETPSDYGDYYAWGEIETKTDYSWTSYKWCNSSMYSLTKYNTSSSYGTVDNKTKLEVSDDVACVKLSGNWRIPTDGEFKELVTTENNSSYKWEWKSLNGHKGWQITYLVNNQSVFLPAAGFRNGSSISSVGSYGYYWSSALNGTPCYAEARYCTPEGVYPYSSSRYYGYSIRPVYIENMVIDVESVELNKTELNLTVGASETLIATVKPDNATDKTVMWTSSDQSIATVENGKVTALKKGDATITAKAGNQTATCKIGVSSNGEYADLGLSVKWATKNLGAETPSDYGDYYAWGEIETKEDYSWATYKWCEGSNTSLTKYNTESKHGEIDNKTVLEADDDIAHVILGDNWRMPTVDELKELIATKDNSSYKWEWKSLNGHNGWQITYLINSQSIFLPAAGYRYGTSFYKVGSNGLYWSSSLFIYGPNSAWLLFFSSESVSSWSGYANGRCNGQSVRPVMD